MILKLRAILFWSHLVAGILAGLFILIMAVTGISIAYQSQILNWAEHDQRFIAGPAGSTPLDIETLIERAQAARPTTNFFACNIFSDPTASVRFLTAGSGAPVFFNPYTGGILGDRNTTAAKFLNFMTSLHRWLALEGDYKSLGKTITGTIVLIYMAMLLSGLFLWLPKSGTWSRSRLRQGAVPNLKLKGKARDWNYHNVLGLWFAPLILISTMTGTILAHPWAGDLVLRLAGSPVPERRSPAKHSPTVPEKNSPKAPEQSLPSKIDTGEFNLLLPIAQKQVSDWHSITILFGKVAQPSVTFIINRGDFGRPDLIDKLTLERSTGAVKNWQPYCSQDLGNRLGGWVEPIHTGEAGGWIGQSIAALTALAGIFLVYTGFSMAWRRFFSRPKPRIQPV